MSGDHEAQFAETAAFHDEQIRRITEWHYQHGPTLPRRPQWPNPRVSSRISGTENEAVQDGALEPVWAAVRAVIAQHPPRSTDDYGKAAENARIWRAVEAALAAHGAIVERATAERIGGSALDALVYQNHRDAVHVADLKAAVEAARTEERLLVAGEVLDLATRQDQGLFRSGMHRAGTWIKQQVERRGTHETTKAGKPMASRSTERYIGNATLSRDPYTGRITVEQADDVIGVLPELWDACEPWARPDDRTFVLDTAGEYRYRLTGETSEHGRPILIFERVKAGPA